MKRRMIDSLDDIDVTHLTFSDIRIAYNTFTGHTTGKRREKRFFPRAGFQTKIGDIRNDIWRQLTEQLISQAGEDDILNNLIEYVGSFPWMKYKSHEHRKDEALDIHVSRNFDSPVWWGFIPFNEKWRPEALAAIEIFEVIFDCCKKTKRYTKQQLDGETEINCPNCGGFTAYQTVNDPDEENRVIIQDALEF
jgi:hypothetical protein